MHPKRETLGLNVIPLRYKIVIEPDIKAFHYKGDETIEVDVKKSTNNIALNGAELSIKGAAVRNKNKEQEAKVATEKEKERITLSFSRKIVGKAQLMISFTGNNSDMLYGFYRSRYKKGNKEKHLLTTQFEAANARNAFPCFDEPSLKARFDLSLIVEKNLDCVSNMPIKEEKALENKKLVAFHTTPRMSTYLLYIGVGEFERKTGRLGDIGINVITVPGKGKYAALGLEYAKKFVDFYQKYFRIRYPLPKIDLIAIPDFAVGAMENWGAITFRETALLGDEKSAVAVKQRIAEIVAHELAHQWFGNLVTMQWWNDIWLNESFATFMAYKAMDKVFPEWNMRAQYVDKVINTALSADQIASTHPISVEVNMPSEIDQIFDEISYEKGGSVLNMLEDYVGSEAFRKGLNSYLKRHAYSNATRSDLWNEIKNKGKNVSEFAKCWIETPGYPAVTIKKLNGKLELTQKRFVLSEKKVPEGNWMIPLNYIYSNSRLKNEKILMKKKRHVIDVQKSSWLKMNYNQNGLYRTIYTKDMVDSLGELIKGSELSYIDAWGIENDLYALARGCRVDIMDYLNFVNNYCFAAKYPLNSSVLHHLRAMYNMLFFYNNENAAFLRKLLKDYSDDIIKQVGWIRTNNESTIITMIRNTAIFSSGLSGNKTTLNRANKMFKLFVNNGVEIDPNIRGAVYGLAAWSGNNSVMKVLRERFVKEQLPEERMRLLGSMGMFSDKRLINSSLEFSLSKNVRFQDSYAIAANTASNPAGKTVIWKWTKQNWKELMSRYKTGTHMLPRYISSFRIFSDTKTLKEITRFFGKSANMRTDLKKELKQAIEVIGINSRFVDSATKE